LIALLALPGCFEGSVLSEEAEWATKVEAYYLDAREIADRFTTADAVIVGLQDKAQAGEAITDEDLRLGYEAKREMETADQDWLALQVPDVELQEPHLQVDKGMRDVISADKELLLAIETGTMDKVSDANATREAGTVAIGEALDAAEAWYAENERRIERGLRNAD
jgi:hypothetical protein